MQRIAKLLYLCAALYAAANLALFPRWTVDDAYITFRYAENLAKHGDLTWNVGEDPIEGYTGVALPTILAGWIWLGGDPQTASDASGIACFFLTAALLALALRRLGAREPIPAAAFFLYLTTPILFLHATSGLETHLFGALVTGSFLALVAALQAESGRAARESLLCAILLFAGLARPEGAALAAIFAGALGLARLRESPGAAARFALRFAAIFALPGAIYFFWRWRHYGHLLPNTYYAKSWFKMRDADASLDAYIEYAIYYLLIPLASGLAVALFGRIAGAAPFSPSGESKPRPSLAWAGGAAAAFVALLLGKYFRTALTMNYSYRFFVPLHPLMLIGFGAAAQWGWTRIDSAGRAPAARLLAGAAAALLALQFAFHVYLLPDERYYARWYRRLLEDEHVAIARFILDNVPREEWILVFKDGGVVPYLTRMKTIDFGRLNDETLAQGKLTDEQQRDYFFSKMPGALVVTSGEWLRLNHYNNSVLNLAMADPRWKEYRLARKYRLLEIGGKAARRPPYFEFLLLRKDLFDRWIAKAGLDQRVTNDPRDKTTVGEYLKEQGLAP